MRKFVIIKNIQLIGVNAKSSDITVGFPAPTAFTGFMHNMQLKTGITFTSIAIGNVNYKVRGNRFNFSTTKFSWLDRSEASKAKGHAPNMPKPKADGKITLCLEFTGEYTTEEIVDKVSNFLRTSRIAGGSVGKFYKPFIKVAADNDELVSVKNAMMPCYVMLDRGAGDQDFIDFALQNKTLPAVNGYKKLKEVVDTGGLRCNNYPTYLAEPTYTTVSYKMASNVNELDQCLWVYTNELNIKTLGGITHD
ncbi:CRISPR-associated protein Csy2 [Vibrio phage 1.161.O._10N.261.48.C5]|nr:CRISPR-associated protein Csy2 [Vibrio phage 1.161.O._10N.261.48.C5]